MRALRGLLGVAVVLGACSSTPASDPATAIATHEGEHEGHKDGSECTCEEGKAGGTTWCTHTNTGYIDGVWTRDRTAVREAMKAKGIAEKESEEGHMHDASCTCAVGVAGGTTWCNACDMGYIHGEQTTDKAAVHKELLNEHASATH